MNRKILEKLLNAETGEEIERIVNTDTFFINCDWVPYGDRSNNVGNIEGQMRDADNALMEKVTNSIDAILMRMCNENGIDPRNREEAPATMAEAVDLFFGGKDKLRKERSKFAKEWLRLTASGTKDRPTITVVDKGEGQKPNDIKETILSLGKDIKEKIPFVYGTYNQGGSSPLGFAGRRTELDYVQLVLTRRAPTINDHKGYNPDHFGFTLVRKRFDQEGQKFTYEYFVEKNSKNVFSFPADKSIPVDDFTFSEGCLIKLYDYQLPQRSSIVFRGLNEFIEKKLPDAPFPIYLKELRTFYKGGRDYTIFGLREKLLRKSSIMREGYPKELPVDLGAIGKKAIEVFVIKHKTQTDEDLGPYIGQPNSDKIFFIKDGLVLHTENTTWLRNECGLVDVSAYIIAFIDISNINPAVAQMLHSGREKFKNTETTKESLERLKLFFGSETFLNLDREYSQYAFSEDSSLQDENLRKQLVKDIISQPELRELFDLGDDLNLKEEGDETPTAFDGTYLPEKFELVGEDPREVEERSFSRVSFDVGADDKLFDRTEDRGEYDWDESESFNITFTSYKNGRLSFRIDPKSSAKFPTEENLKFYLRVPSKGIKFTSGVTMKIIPPVPYIGKTFPTFFRAAQDTIKLPISSTRKIVIKTDAEDHYFTRESSPGELTILPNDDLYFGKPSLQNGILAIKVRYNGTEIKKVQDADIAIKDTQNSFNLRVAFEITKPEGEPQLKLPKPILITRDKWDSDIRPWDEDSIARIPSWGELTKIKINTDSRLFDDAKKITTGDREALRNVLVKQIYMSSVWLFLELRGLELVVPEGGESLYLDPKDEMFEKAIRAASKSTLQNVKKLLR